MKPNPYLSVVIPAYNEENNIRNNVLDEVFSFLKKKDYTWEVLIVDDGSTDDTLKLLASVIKLKRNVSVIGNSHQGKAGTVTAGMLKATGNYILFTDFDQATPISELDTVLPHLKEYDIVIGSRSGRRNGAPLSRLVMARGFMVLRSLILGLRVDDTQCGFKAFRKDVAHSLFRQMKLYKDSGGESGSRVTAGFDVELLFLAVKMGYSVKEVPVEWRYVESRRVSPVRDSVEGLFDLLRIKAMDIKGEYE